MFFAFQLLHPRIQKLDFSQMRKPMLITDKQIRLIGVCKNLVYLNLNSLTEISSDGKTAAFDQMRSYSRRRTKMSTLFFFYYLMLSLR